MLTVLLIVLLFCLFAGPPAYYRRPYWGPAPYNAFGLILFVVLLFILFRVA